MSFVVAVDVGIKNLGLCVYDPYYRKFVHWETTSLVPVGRYIPALNVQYVRDFVQRYHRYFENASVVLVERQMRCNMRIIESVLQTMFFNRCLIISPRSVKAHFGLSMKNYRENKERAVSWAHTFIEQHKPAFFAPEELGFHLAKKKDDLADSLLLVVYYIDTYSNPTVTASPLHAVDEEPTGGAHGDERLVRRP